VILFNAHHVVHFTLRGNATLPNNASNQALAKARALAVDGYMKTLGIHASTTISSTVSGSTYDYSYLVVYVATS
jgi:outer membrane protein OmpA-like peptidoglycan-associated protein